MTKYILSTIAGVESLAKKELEKINAKNLLVNNRMIEFEGDNKTMIKANLWSRVGNKVYQVLAEGKNIDNFDKLYDLIFSINFKEIYKNNFPILVKVKSINSKLDSTPAIQKITKKSIIDNLTNKSGKKLIEDKNLVNFEITVLLKNNKAQILLNTTGEALHKRGYRFKTGEAPVKESLAAALVLLLNWNFKKDFYDPFCGSGTIAIEAAMIARNIAPGLDRYFAFENLGLVDKKIIEEEIQNAKKKKFEGNYKIFASDIDEKMIEIAKENAKEAGVLDTIIFEQKDFKEYLNQELSGTLVSNPPYGERLKVEFLDDLYKNINRLLKQNKDLNGGIITSYFEGFDKIINLSDYKKRKLYNGGEKCYFYRKK